MFTSYFWHDEYSLQYTNAFANIANEFGSGATGCPSIVQQMDAIFRPPPEEEEEPPQNNYAYTFWFAVFGLAFSFAAYTIITLTDKVQPKIKIAHAEDEEEEFDFWTETSIGKIIGLAFTLFKSSLK